MILVLTLFLQEEWPLETPFHTLAERILSGTADRGEVETLVGLMKSDRLPGPWHDEVRVAESRDGLTFTELRVTAVRRASVPEAVVDERGSVWLFYVDTDADHLLRRPPFKTGLVGIGGLAAARSEDGLRFAPVDMEIANVLRGEVVDPDVVRAPDGTYQMYYLGVEAKHLHPRTPDPARSTAPHDFYLATSRDLARWEQKRVVWTGPHGGADPAVYRTGERTYFILAGGSGRSDDGGLTFREVRMQTGAWGQPDVVAVPGGYRAYFTAMREGIRSAFSADGVTWREEEGSRLRGGADPSVVRWKDGWRMYFKVRGER